MRKIYLLPILLLFAVAGLSAQSTISITVNGINREYILYVPPGHNGQVAAPLVINFHGYTSNALQQQIYSNMNAVADTADFIVVYPDGLGNAWNSYGFQASPDDVAFTEAIIEDVNSRLRVDASRVYACGMSNGGYMSYLLACQLEDRIAAIVSVTGLLAPGVKSQCNPNRAVPVLQIHGTDDATVPYNGGRGIGSVDSTMQFWLAENNCPTGTTVIDTLPNTNNTDNSYPIRYRTVNCDGGTEVTLIKIVDGGHTWPNAPFLIPGLVTNKDIDGSAEAWAFLSKYTHPNPTLLDTTTSIKSVKANGKLIKTYPNPIGNQLNVEITDERVKYIALYDVLGAKIYEAVVAPYATNYQVNTSSLPSGVYLLHVATGTAYVTYKLIK